MIEDEIAILCTGDLHLGRHPSRIPERLDGPECSPKAVWRETVQQAIDRDVDAVVVTGDIADRENQYFEAYGAFEDGAIRLDEAEIPTITVAGNHDCDVFPRIVKDVDLDHLQLLGENGSWERWILERDGDPLVHFDGWSFPDEHVHESPLDEYDLPNEDVPTIGVLHAELDSRGSQYAPVQSSELRDTYATAWLLGHIHSPGVPIESDPLALYPGSPQALDSGEPGAHGPWMLTVDSEGNTTIEHLPLSSIRYDHLKVDVSGANDPQAVTPMVTEQIQEHVQSISNVGQLELFLAHVQLTGRTEAHADLVDQRPRIREQLGTKIGSVDVRIGSINVETRPEVDLEARAQGDDAVAYLANLLLELETGERSDEHEPLVTDSLNAMRQTHSASAYNILRRESDIDQPNQDDALEMVERQARVLLDTLLNQKEGKV
jgi:DNA repair exonuclease SbcCD nuclease subunit